MLYFYQIKPLYTKLGGRLPWYVFHTLYSHWGIITILEWKLFGILIKDLIVVSESTIQTFHYYQSVILKVVFHCPCPLSFCTGWPKAFNSVIRKISKYFTIPCLRQPELIWIKTNSSSLHWIGTKIWIFQTWQGIDISICGQRTF